MATEFRRVFRVQGMDTNAVPRFQMVPEKGDRWIALHDGAGVTLTALPGGICDIVEIPESGLPADDRASGATAAVRGDRFFRLRGTSKGSCLIMATGGPLLIPQFLEVAVKPKFTQRVRFWTVSDNAHHHATRPLAIVGQWLPVLNYIFKRQANVEFVRHGALRPLPEIASNLGDPIQLPSAGGLGANATLIVNGADTTADLNVFFVWELRRAATGDSTEATTQTIGSAHSGSTGNILIEDDVDGRDDLALAHEIGHHLGLFHNTSANINLMFPSSPLQGFSLNRAEVLTCNQL